MQIDKIVVITRRTRLEENIRRFNTKDQARFFVKSRGQSFDDYELEYSNYQKSKDELMLRLPRGVKFQEIDREFLPNFLFGPNDLVVTLGQDGLVVNAGKYLSGQNVIALNPDPARFDGILLPFLPEQLDRAVEAVAADKFIVKHITMARVDLPDGQFLYAVNDIFIGPRSHTSALYTIKFGKKEERQISSGLIVSTPAGSTGWMSSLYNMAGGIARFSGEKSKVKPRPLDWELEKLVFIVREPFQSKWSGVELVAGEIDKNHELILESQMPDTGVIFSDGILNDFLEFNSGAVATVRVAEKTTNLVTEI